MSLQLRAVGFAYRRGDEVLSEIELSVSPGELVCLIGPNGSGKSTLLQICAGLLAADRGEANWSGKALSSWEPLDRARHVAFLPQNSSDGGGLCVEEIVRLGRHPHIRHVWTRMGEADEAVVQAAIERMQLTELVNRRLEELSGGERQRVLIAASLAQGGDLLLLDEPTASLDLHHEVAGMALLRELSREGRCVVCATHDLNLAAAMADRLLLLDHGKIRASGTPSEVLREEHLHAVYGSEVWVGPHPAGKGIAVLPRPASHS